MKKEKVKEKKKKKVGKNSQSLHPQNEPVLVEQIPNHPSKFSGKTKR